MAFVQDLSSTEPQIIKNVLLSILHSKTPTDILNIHRQFTEAQDKHVFLAQFEADETIPLAEDSIAYVAAAKRSAQFERWTHYIWMRLELMQLANQKAALNYIMSVKSEAKLSKTFVPSLDSVSSAIQQDAFNGVPIQQSIAVLKKIGLQIVGTEHPTDPLSQEARNKSRQSGQALINLKYFSYGFIYYARIMEIFVNS